jgi:N utilization substance protein B
MKTEGSAYSVVARHAARVLAVQVFYWVDSQTPGEEEDLNKIILGALESYQSFIPGAKKIEEKYFVDLIQKSVRNKADLAQLIAPHLAQDWKFERLGSAVRAILIVAVTELRSNKELDSAIIINEYLEIAKLLNHSNEVGFINSVLDKVAKIDLS